MENKSLKFLTSDPIMVAIGVDSELTIGRVVKFPPDVAGLDSADDLVGHLVTIELVDENGGKITRTGVVSEVL